MKAKQFVSHLSSLIPPNINGIVGDILNKMEIEPQIHQTAYSDELSFLINNYEMDGVEIGMISFLGKYKITDHHFLFGRIELDFLGFDRKTREIVLLDHDDISFVMMKCAKDSISFLQILKTYSTYVIHSLLKKQPPKIDFNSLYSEAGGVEYGRFIEFLFSPAVK